MGTLGKVSAGHWIIQYWNKERWVTIDVGWSLSLNDTFDPYDVPNGKFDFPADERLDVRAGEDNPKIFWNAKPETGLIVVLLSLFYDFHFLMNNEIIYLQMPKWGEYKSFAALTELKLKEIDNLALLMQKPDENFSKLKKNLGHR